MFALRHAATFFILLTFIFCLIPTTHARRKHDRRRDLDNVVPIAESGWKVPLEGGKTCEDSTRCTDELTAPPVTSILKYLAIGRGTVTYSCVGQEGNQPPMYMGQNAFLYDAAPLVPKFTSEDQFHSYIPRFLEYDYTSLENSTLDCIGNVQRIDNLTVFTIYNVDAFAVEFKEGVNSPDNRQFDLTWAHSRDDDAEWDIYRVETAGGGPPYDCGDQIISQEIPVEYVAEYWFYRRDENAREGMQR